MNRRNLLKLLVGIGAVGGAGGLIYESPGIKDELLRLTSRQPSNRPFPYHLADVTDKAGVSFQHNNGAFGMKYLPETLGSGCAFFDYDNDDWLDILLINGKDWPGHFRHRSTMHLYHNNHDGTFTDVTERAGLNHQMYGIGVAVGDYDNDGFEDFYVTTNGQNHLFHNNGDGTFTDVTKHSGLEGYSSLSTSAMWFDYDRDGHLDLFVCNYVKWSPQTDIFCSLNGRTKSYCTPEAYPGTTCWLFHNRGNGTFEDVTGKSGLYDPTSKSLGVTMIDYNNNGWPDIFVANDTQPNKLYRNNKNGTFTEIGVQAGVAFSENGVARAGMGTDAADYNNSGFPSIVVTNFSQQMLGLYKNNGHGFFIDEAPDSTLGQSTRLELGFGCFFFDVDMDGLLDLLVANGHIDSTIHDVDSGITYAEPPRLFHNIGQGRFRDISKLVGKSFIKPKVARGAAYGDFDNDGDLDVLMTTDNGPAYLYRTDLTNDNQSIRFETIGVRSNRDGIGTTAHVWTPNGQRWLTVKSGTSYLSCSSMRLTFGLGHHRYIEKAILEWPSGLNEELGRLEAGRTYVVKEGKGVIRDIPFRPAT